MPNWKKLIVSGSDANLNTLNIQTALIASGLNYPDTDGSAGQAITTDGNGNLTFNDATSPDITGSSVITASISGQTLTFTKGDTSTFNVTIPTSGGGGDVNLSATAHLTQSVAAQTWSFQHDLDDRIPVLTVFDSNHDVIIPERIEMVDEDNMKIYFSSARTGYASAAVMGVTSSYAFNAGTASYVEYSDVANKPTLLSSSLQIASDISGSFTDLSSSLQGRVSTLEDFSSSLDATFATDEDLNIVSSSVDSLNAATSSYALKTEITGSFTSLSSSIGSDIEDIIDGTTTITSASYAVSASYAANVPETASYALSALSSSYAITSSYSENFNATGSITINGYTLPLTDGVDGQAIITDGDGVLTFDDIKVYTQVKNISGTTLAKGTPVHATASAAPPSGNVSEVIAASASLGTAMPATFVLDEEIANDAEGRAIAVGYIRGVNTTGFTVGDVVYVGPNGGYTNVKPTGSDLIQNLGVVTRVDSTNGAGFIYGSGRSNDVPNILEGYAWVGNSNQVATATATSSFFVTSGSHALNADTSSYVDFDNIDNKPTLLSGSAQIAEDISGSFTDLSSSLASELLKNTTDTLTGDLTVTGTITAQEFHTEFVSASIIYESGSTKFGDTLDDRHDFTGSLNVTGSVTATSFSGLFEGALSSSAQIASDISGSFTDLSSSLEGRVSSNEGSVSSLNSATSSYALKDEISGSFTDLSSSLEGRISSNEGSVTSLNSATSSYALANQISGSFTDLSSSLEGRISDQEDFSSSLDATFATDADLNLVSSSVDSLNAATSSYALKDEISGSITSFSSSIAGRVAANESFSSSLDTTLLTLSGSFSGSFVGDGSQLSGVTSYTDADTLSYINTLGVVSGSEQIDLGSAAGTASHAVSSSFTLTASYAENAGAGAGFPFEGDAVITGSFLVSGSFVDLTDATVISGSTFSGSFVGDGTGLSGLGYGDTKKLEQTSAATTWSFSHNMNEQFPTVTVYNDSNEVIQPSKIEGVDAQTLKLYFGVPTAGTAVAVVGGTATTQEAGFNRVLSQTSAATTWSFAHNLGNKYPQVIVYDSNDEFVLPGKVEAVDQNNLNIYFDTAQSGTATATVGGTSLTASYADSLVVSDTLLTTGENTDVDTGTETVATVSTTYYDGAFFDYVAKDGTNYRAGTVMAVWDGSSVQYADNSTADIGDTSGVTLAVDISGTDARLRATVTSDNWNIKAFVRAL